MTDMPTTPEMRDALARWQRTLEHGDARALRSAGAATAALLERVAACQGEVEERRQLVAETYSASGLPKRAAERARRHGAVVTITRDGRHIAARFPNGSTVLAMTRQAARETEARGVFMGKVVTLTRGAAPGAGAAARVGEHIADVLNRFADEREARNGRV